MQNLFKFILFTIILCGAIKGYTQSPCEEANYNFLNNYGNSLTENPCIIQQIGSDGYIIGGTKAFQGISIGFLIRLNRCGEILWQKYYDADEIGQCIGVVLEGNEILVALNNDWKTALLKIDLAGNLLSSKQFGVGQTYPRNMIKSNDNNLLFVGVSNANSGFGSNDMYLVKSKLDGTILWSRQFGKYANEFGHNLFQDPNGDIILVGYTRDYSGTLRTGLIFKFTPTGDMIWNKEYHNGGGQTYIDYCTYLNDAYYFSGACNHLGNGQEDILVIKTDVNGNIIWSKLIGTNGYDQGLSIEAYDDHLYLFSLVNSDENGIENILIKIDLDGNVIEHRTFGTKSDELIFFRAAKNFDIVSDGFYGYSVSENGLLGSRDILAFHYQRFEQFCATTDVEVLSKNAQLVANPFNASLTEPSWTSNNLVMQLFNTNSEMVSTTICSNFPNHISLEPINIFSPNEDGLNDIFTFRYKSDSIADFYCIILNRWGVTINFINEIENGWNGTTINNESCPDGTYFYIYEAKGLEGSLYKGQGTIQLIR